MTYVVQKRKDKRILIFFTAKSIVFYQWINKVLDPNSKPLAKLKLLSLKLLRRMNKYNL